MTAEELTHAQARKLANRFLDEVPTPGEPYGVVRDGCAMARHILSLPPDTDEQAQRIAELEAQLAARGPDREAIAQIIADRRRLFYISEYEIADAIIASGALATAQAVTLTEEINKWKAYMRHPDRIHTTLWLSNQLETAIKYIDRLTNGASTPAHPTQEGEK